MIDYIDNKLVRIMFVCHGNICRSPMAEIIFREMIKKAGYANSVEVFSSATSTEEIWHGVGNPIYPPARRELLSRGYDVPEHRATLLLPEDYNKYDLFVCMDERNIRAIRRIFKNDSGKKISKLLDYTDRGGDVADPWYTGDFEIAFNDIKEGCCALFSKLFKIR